MFMHGRRTSPEKPSEPPPTTPEGGDPKERLAKRAKEHIDTQLHSVEQKLEKKSWWQTVKGWGTSCYDALKKSSTWWKAAGIGVAGVSAALMLGFDPFGIGAAASKLGLTVGKFLFPGITKKLWHERVELTGAARMEALAEETEAYRRELDAKEILLNNELRELGMTYETAHALPPSFLESIFGHVWILGHPVI